jgi:hypothetical protein
MVISFNKFKWNAETSNRFILTNFYTLKRNPERDHQSLMSLVESDVPIDCQYERVGLKGSTLGKVFRES